MLARLILVFILVSLVVLAVKKSLNPAEEVIQRVPGYPEPVALIKKAPVTDEEFMKNLPSAKDYAFSFSAPEREMMGPPQPQKVEKKKFAKRSVATKSKKSRLVKR